MSRSESDRENMMRDATALRIRAEIQIPDCDDSVVAGCRDNGGWSFYFGQDPCYHFSEAGELRRAFAGDRLYRTQGETLAKLHRVRLEESTQLIRRDLDRSELDSFLSDMRARLTSLRTALHTGTAKLIQAVPDDTDVPGQLLEFLRIIADTPRALAPAVKTRPR